MFEYIRNILTAKAEDTDSNKSFQKRIQIATCALYVEMAKADDHFTEEEREKIISFVRNEFQLDDDEINELIGLTEESIKKSVSIYEFGTLVESNFTQDEKFELLKNLWRLIYVDKKLDMYEDNLIKRIGDLLKMEHKEVITAKLMVKGELNL